MICKINNHIMTFTSRFSLKYKALQASNAYGPALKHAGLSHDAPGRT